MLKFPITVIIGNGYAECAYQVGNELFWGYFWGYPVIDCDTRPFRISSLRHLFDCLLGNPFVRLLAITGNTSCGTGGYGTVRIINI